MDTGRAGTIGGVSFDSMLCKSFFAKQGFLPKKTIKEFMHDFPAEDVKNGAGTWARSHGTLRYTSNAQESANYVWDMGTLYTKILVIVSGVRLPNYNIGPYIAKTSPPAPVTGCDGWMGTTDTFSSLGFGIFHLDTFSPNATEKQPSTTPAVDSPNAGMALYIDTVTPKQLLWVREGNEGWIKMIDAAMSGIDSARYAGFFINTDTGSAKALMQCPVGIYAE